MRGGGSVFPPRLVRAQGAEGSVVEGLQEKDVPVLPISFPRELHSRLPYLVAVQVEDRWGASRPEEGAYLPLVLRPASRGGQEDAVRGKGNACPCVASSAKEAHLLGRGTLLSTSSPPPPFFPVSLSPPFPFIALSLPPTPRPPVLGTCRRRTRSCPQTSLLESEDGGPYWRGLRCTPRSRPEEA